MKINNKERLEQFGKQVWNLLTDKEKSIFKYTIGLYGFIEQLMDMLHHNEIYTPDEFDAICDYVTMDVE